MADADAPRRPTSAPFLGIIPHARMPLALCIRILWYRFATRTRVTFHIGNCIPRHINRSLFVCFCYDWSCEATR